MELLASLKTKIMLQFNKMSKKPLDILYAILWIGIFGAVAVYVYSGKVFEPYNGKIHIVAILIGWVAQYIGLFLTALLCFAIGVYKAVMILFSNKYKE
jgi:hypothetical protein